MGTVSIRFYTVTMPDGKKYCAVGGSKKKVAYMCKVEEKNVVFGADSKLPYVSSYTKHE